MEDEDQKKQVQNYILQRTLGQGTFGKVKLGYHIIADEYVAIKILEKSRIENQCDLIRIQREISILKKVCHQNVIKLYEVILQYYYISKKIIQFQSNPQINLQLYHNQNKILESESCVYLVMEYAKGGELYEYIIKKKQLPENIAIHYFQQLVFATQYLHSLNITHRDLKPENLLLDENKQLKIADFGLSYMSQTKGEQLKTACGSPCYAAPEMLGIHLNQQAGKTYEGTKSDIWSCGIILFAMLCGYLQMIQTFYYIYNHQISMYLLNTRIQNNYMNQQRIVIFKNLNIYQTMPQIYQQISQSKIQIKDITLNKLNTVIQYISKKQNINLIYPQKIQYYKTIGTQTSIPTKNLSLNDQTIITKMIEMGYKQNQIIHQLQSNKHNTITTIYYLLLKKFNLPNRKSFYQNIQNIGNLKLDINQKRFTISKFQPSQQGSPILEKFDKVKQSIRSKLDNSPYLKTQISQKFKKSKRVSVQIENQRQKTNSVQENHFDCPYIFTANISDQKSKIQSRKNSIYQASYKPILGRDIEQVIKTDINEDVLTNQKGVYAQVRQRNKTQPNKNEDTQKYFEKTSKLNISHQMVEKTPQYSPYINMNLSNHRQLFKQIYNGNLSDLMKKKK